ncbi:uncharacterized protein TRIVIDRAFT_227854 [Trichoderma virens Gv29-8]|uniref:Uncharacterized protein n=1 Tax=Hypocrea virens (strain Gv29-8 / FGSC 10586) TaxID=413071 RepID=G9NAQ6_HYPVG|nr:uncharacterized protein TRIVIDRAFT_227854 [Trichoderma virens Gv29-8]EHK15917.1 hypothetical protein TRIVIDRAFT_227854 [Trichoderma virens Gv29-8]UKZ56313.1 hypothetical protein TrVGV298_010148 [Trichoderma virens]
MKPLDDSQRDETDFIVTDLVPQLPISMSLFNHISDQQGQLDNSLVVVDGQGAHGEDVVADCMDTDAGDMTVETDGPVCETSVAQIPGSGSPAPDQDAAASGHQPWDVIDLATDDGNSDDGNSDDGNSDDDANQSRDSGTRATLELLYQGRLAGAICWYPCTA